MWGGGNLRKKNIIIQDSMKSIKLNKINNEEGKIIPDGRSRKRKEVRVHCEAYILNL